MEQSVNSPAEVSPSPDQNYLAGDDGIYRPRVAVQHRDEEYDEAGFDVLLRMQSDHFWYRGRHRFLLAALRRTLASQGAGSLSGCDLGGGCGGWIRYLQTHSPNLFSELAVTDSSLVALDRAGTVVGDSVRRYQTDLLNLHWQDRWNVAFLLDVLEHIPDDVGAMQQIYQALKPGGLVFVATPALQFFWSFNDEFAHHQRRYSKTNFQQLACETGFKLLDARYFMFYLSPLLFLARRKRPDTAHMTNDELRKLLDHSHRVPSKPVNAILTAAFSAETPLGHWLSFPWGTSILGVFQKPQR